jgi:prephenate dehydratase
MKIGYLGPPGTFTYRGTCEFVHKFQKQFPDEAMSAVPVDTVSDVFTALEAGEIDYGVAAIDNTVEGPVFATIDGLLQHPGIVAIADTWLPIQFDAYALAGEDTFKFGVAHSHALAQVSDALERFGVQPLAAASNGAALADLAPGQIAFGPPGYSREAVVTIAKNVGDYPDAKTQFVLLALNAHPEQKNDCTQHEYQTMLAIIPGDTGPGVLARITAEFAGRNLNLSALFSRPIKGVAGQYVFIVTVDAAPDNPDLIKVRNNLTTAQDNVRILGAW